MWGLLLIAFVQGLTLGLIAITLRVYGSQL
jgi:hypothetical protein